jgi:hypothetical protein
MIAKRFKHARGVCGTPPPENFEKLYPKSCNLSELKVILLNWKKDLFWREKIFLCIPQSDLSTRTPFLKFGFDFIEYVM